MKIVRNVEDKKNAVRSIKTFCTPGVNQIHTVHTTRNKWLVATNAHHLTKSPECDVQSNTKASRFATIFLPRLGKTPLENSKLKTA